MADESPDDLIAEARERFNRCAEAEDRQRKVIVAAKKYLSGDQWPDDVRIQRAGGASLQGVAAQPPRPLITVDRLSSPVRQVANAIRSANFGIDVLPNGFGANDETSKVFKGYIRRVQNQARTDDPIGWAGFDAVASGLGWFRLRTEYADRNPRGDRPTLELFDQELRLERIVNNLSVYRDPSAMPPTYRDMQYAFVTEDIPKEEFKRRWPKADVHGLEDFEATGDSSPWGSWVSQDTIRIAEYWRVTYTTKEFALLEDGSIVPGDRIPKDMPVKVTRAIPIPQIKGCKINAVEVLPREDADPDMWDWLGTRIPLFPILGEELNVDGVTELRGLIQSAMDPQRMLNFSYSAVVEMYALATKTPWILAEGQNEGYEQFWQNANRFNFSFLPYKPTTVSGLAVPPPQRQVAEPPIQAAVEMVKLFEEAIKATTAMYDPSLGNSNPREHSGRAILALQQQGEQTQSHFMSNVQMAYLEVGAEMVHIIPQITRPGQILQILGIDDKPEQVMVGQAYQLQKGTPTPVQGMSAEQAKASDLTKFYDLNSGKYGVTVNVGKSYTTRKQEGAAMIGDILEKNPPMTQLIGDIFFRDLDFPGSEEVSERMKKMLPPQLQEQEGEGPTPQMLQQELQKVSQLFQLATKELQEKTHIIETEQVKANQELQKEKLKAQATEQEALIESETKIRIAQIQAEATIGSAQIKAGMDQLAEELAAHSQILNDILGQGHEAGMQAREHEHELRMAGAQAQQEQAMQEGEQGHEAELAGQQQSHEQDLASQQAEAAQRQLVTQAALKPKPERE
jgi:portal protein